MCNFSMEEGVFPRLFTCFIDILLASSSHLGRGQMPGRLIGKDQGGRGADKFCFLQENDCMLSSIPWYSAPDIL